VTPDEVTAALAARKPMSAPNGSVDSWWGVWTKSTVVAVNLADPLWRVAEAARAHKHIWVTADLLEDDLPETPCAICDALAALAATREETP